MNSMFCGRCGKPMGENEKMCIYCGFVMQNHPADTDTNLSETTPPTSDFQPASRADAAKRRLTPIPFEVPDAAIEALKKAEPKKETPPKSVWRGSPRGEEQREHHYRQESWRIEKPAQKPSVYNPYPTNTAVKPVVVAPNAKVHKFGAAYRRAKRAKKIKRLLIVGGIIGLFLLLWEPIFKFYAY